MATPIDVLVFKCRKICLTEMGEVVRYLTLKNIKKIRRPFQLSLLRGSRPKSARTSPQQCAHTAPDFIKSLWRLKRLVTLFDL